MIHKFTSIRQTIDEALRLGIDSTSQHREHWYNNESAADTFRLAAEGDMRLVPAAKSLLLKLETRIETPKKIWERSPVGVFTAIPEHVAGFPTPMRRLVEVPNSRRPMTIYVCTTSSGGISAEVMTKRGTVILALVMALIRTRPTRLHLLSILDGYRDKSGETVFTIPVSTAPLDLARACYSMTSVAYARRINYELAREMNGFLGGWPDGFNYHNPKPYFDKLMLRLGADPKSTLVVPAAQLGDELLSDPIKWITKQVDTFNPKQYQEDR